MKQVSLQELKQKLDSKQDFMLLDVRTEQEFQAYHVQGAVNIDHRLVEQRAAEVPRDKPVVILCRTGNRTMHAARVLESLGYANVGVVLEGTSGWNEFLKQQKLVDDIEYEENKRKIGYQVMEFPDGSKRII